MRELGLGQMSQSDWDTHHYSDAENSNRQIALNKAEDLLLYMGALIDQSGCISFRFADMLEEKSMLLKIRPVLEELEKATGLDYGEFEDGVKECDVKASEKFREQKLRRALRRVLFFFFPSYRQT